MQNVAPHSHVEVGLSHLLCESPWQTSHAQIRDRKFSMKIFNPKLNYPSIFSYF